MARVINTSDNSDVLPQGTTNLYLTSAERTKLTNTTGTNSGDQTNVTGNSGTATKLQTARNINGIAFDGTANITVTDTTKVTDLPEVTLGTAGQLTINQSTVGTATGTYSAPTLAGTLTSPLPRFDFTNGTTSNVTLSFPNAAGTTVNLTVLPGEIVTFRQTTLNGYRTVSSNKPLAQTDIRYIQKLFNTLRVASSTATATEKASADYVCDGTGDEVEINAALTALKANGGGLVQLSSGTYNLAATIFMEGVNTPDDTPGLQLIGAAGGNTTRLVGAANTPVITLRYMPQVRIKDLWITMNGMGDGVKAIGNTIGANDRRGFWNSQFENLYFIGTNTHSGWCMNLESPFRSRFNQLGTGNGVGNGLWFKSHYAQFNPGNCVIEVCQMGLSNPNGTSYRIESANDGGFMNILTFIECDSIDTAASTSSIGWYFKGSSTSYFTARDIRVIGANPEQFNTAVKMEKAANVRFLGDFINPKTNGFVADISADSVNNRIEVEYIYVNGTSTVNAFRDLNTDALKPNVFKDSFARVESGGTLTISPSTASVVYGLARDSDGTGVYPAIWQSQQVPLRITSGGSETARAIRSLVIGNNLSSTVAANGDLTINATSNGITRAITNTSGNYTVPSTTGVDQNYFITGAHTGTMATASSNTNEVTFMNVFTASVQVNRAGTDTFYTTVPGVTTLDIAPGQSLTVISNGTSVWKVK